MLSTASLVKRLRADFPQFVFKADNAFHWSHSDQTIHFDRNENSPSLLIHELSHAILDHQSYRRDVELLAMEREAWDKAKELGRLYGVRMDDDLIQDNLDTYRDWLHARSTCPNCETIGLQIKQLVFECPNCHQLWRVNEARTRALRRYKIANK